VRKTLLSGLLLIAAAFLTVQVGAWLDLELDEFALLGVAAGAVVALVPDATVARRFSAFVLGVVLTLVAFFVRAALLPDTSGGRAVFAAVAVALCVVAALVSMDRLPLWALLLGCATFAGTFESIYNEAPPQVLPNAVNTLSGLGLCIAAGFFAGAFVAPQQKKNAGAAASNHDELLENTK
jgi:hypothetical protein